MKKTIVKDLSLLVFKDANIDPYYNVEASETRSPGEPIPNLSSQIGFNYESDTFLRSKHLNLRYNERCKKCEGTRLWPYTKLKMKRALYTMHHMLPFPLKLKVFRRTFDSDRESTED